MASFLGSSNNKKSTVSLRGDPRSRGGPSTEQKAVHIESLLRKLYAKVDELEAVCKEEKEFHQLLKNKGRRGLPKIDADCLNRVVTSQQRCAESAFNKLDVIKRGNRSSGRRAASNHSKEGEKEITGLAVVAERGKSPSTRSISRGPPVELNNVNKGNDYSNYGSLDRNFRKKKGAFSDRNRRNTKTVGSLAGLDVVDSVELLKPDEQYKYGLPTVEINSTTTGFGAPILVSSIPHQLFSINLRTNDQIPSHSALNWQPQQPVPALALNYDGFHHHQPIFHRRSVSHDPRTMSISSSNPIKNLEPPPREDPPLNSTTIPEMDASPFNDYVVGDTDVNFNCLAISSPTDGASERSSSKSSENGDLKNSFVNESCKPFEMSDYYKYSTKFRIQANEKVTSSSKTSGEPKFHRMNGTTNLRVDIVTTPDSTTIDGLTLHSNTATTTTTSTSSGDNVGDNRFNDNLNNTMAPKLPPKLRPMNLMYKNGDGMGQSEMQKRKHESLNCNNPGHEIQETAWIHINPTIV